MHEPRGGNDRVNGSGKGGVGQSYRCCAPQSNIRTVQADTHTRAHKAAWRQRGSGRDALLWFLQGNMPCVWIFSPYKLSRSRTHTHAIKGQTHQMLSNGTEMKENFIRGRSGEAGWEWGRRVRGASAN